MARQIAKNTNISTVLCILTNEFGYNYQYLPWMLHILKKKKPYKEFFNQM